MRLEGWSAIAFVSFHVIHYLCVAVWVGTMFFNLLVGFPLIWKRAGGNMRHYTEAMAAQGVSAAPWLYFLVTFTLLSGWLILWMTPSPMTFVAIKHALFAGMVACHIYGTIVLWPRIIFSVDSEVPALFGRYKALMIASTALGVAAIAMSYYWSIVR